MFSLSKWWKELRDKRKDPVADTLEVYRILNNILRETPVQFIHLLRVESVGRKKLASIIYEVCDRSVLGVRDRWQNEALEDDILELLEEVAEKKYVYNSVDTVKAAVIRDFELTFGFTGSSLLKIKDTRKAFFFLIMHYKNGDAADAEARRSLLLRARELEKLV